MFGEVECCDIGRAVPFRWPRRRVQWFERIDRAAASPDHAPAGPRFRKRLGSTAAHCTGDRGPATSENFDDRSLALPQHET